ncbi:MAG: hypothetical protein ACXWBR_10850 [Usitatibacter sp.]
MVSPDDPAAAAVLVDGHQSAPPQACDDGLMKQPIPETPPDYDRTRMIERPDGFYWQAKDGTREYGPFATLLEMAQDMQSFDVDALEPGETREEAQAEIGIADWIDPETGEPAEQDGSHLEEH